MEHRQEREIASSEFHRTISFAAPSTGIFDMIEGRRQMRIAEKVGTGTYNA